MIGTTLSRRLACVCMRSVTSTSVHQHARRIALQHASNTARQHPITQTRYFTQHRPLYATQTTADEKIEEITELYATAKDEFEIAAEETEKMTVYAEEDRGAAREALTALQTAYKQVIEGQDRQLGEEVQRRIGQRIRELERAVEAMEEQAQNQD